MTVKDLLDVIFINDIEKLVVLDYTTEDELLNVERMGIKYKTSESKEDYIIYKYGKCEVFNITPKMVNDKLKLLVFI